MDDPMKGVLMLHISLFPFSGPETAFAARNAVLPRQIAVNCLGHGSFLNPIQFFRHIAFGAAHLSCDFWLCFPFKIICLRHAANIFLRDISDKLDSNLYIIPSSVHEVLVLSEKLGDDKKSLQEMIRMVNETHLEPQDILSDSLYFYDRNDEKISIA